MAGDDASPSPLLRPLRVVLVVLAIVLLATLLATGLDSCHHAGHV